MLNNTYYIMVLLETLISNFLFCLRKEPAPAPKSEDGSKVLGFEWIVELEVGLVEFIFWIWSSPTSGPILFLCPPPTVTQAQLQNRSRWIKLKEKCYNTSQFFFFFTSWFSNNRLSFHKLMTCFHKIVTCYLEIKRLNIITRIFLYSFSNCHVNFIK